jgi:hypothetical protein
MPVVYKGSILNTETHKYCAKCDAIKERSEFHKNSKRHDKIETYCKICSHSVKLSRLRNDPAARQKQRESGKKYRQENPEKCLEISKSYRERNKEKIAEKRKSEERRTYNKEYMRKLRSDPIFRIKCNVSRQIIHSLKRKEGSKHGQSVLDKLGYSLQQLKEHLEKQFDENMNWENYGTYWHIDHIVPHSSFSYTSMDDEEFKKCWSLNNLRPLEAIENIKKSNKLLVDFII